MVIKSIQTAVESDYARICVFPGGDVEIVVIFKGERIIGKIVSNNMVAASQVWKNYIFPPWETATSESDVKRIDCSASNGFALLVLLRIIHLQFDGVPEKLTDQVLYGVAELVEEFQCRPLVQPWVEKWLSLIDDTTTSWKLQSQFPEQWLYNTWALGHKEKFESVARFIACQASVNSKTEQLVVYKGDVRFRRDGTRYTAALKEGAFQRSSYRDSLSDSMEDEIRSLRLNTIASLLAIPYTRLDLFGGTRQNNSCLVYYPPGHKVFANMVPFPRFGGQASGFGFVETNRAAELTGPQITTTPQVSLPTRIPWDPGPQSSTTTSLHITSEKQRIFANLSSFPGFGV